MADELDLTKELEMNHSTPEMPTLTLEPDLAQEAGADQAAGQAGAQGAAAAAMEAAEGEELE